jgi:hypothetical protein
VALLVDPDVEGLLISYLATELPEYGMPNVPVSDRPPQTGVESVVLYRTGGVRRDLVSDQAQITVDTRAARGSRAVQIIQLVRALLNDLWGKQIDGFAVYDVNELSGPYVNPTEMDAIRYSQSFLVVVRSKSLVQ